jgi:hypothetical protein
MSDIIPTVSTTTNIIVRFEAFINDLILNTSASFKVWLYDIHDKLIDVKIVSMVGEDYTKWGNDDEYVLQFIATQLGFTLIKVPPQ